MVSLNATFVFASAFFTLAFALIFLLSRFWAVKYYPEQDSIPYQSRYLYAAGLFFGAAVYLLGQAMLENSQKGPDGIILFWHRFQHAGLIPALFFWPLLVSDYIGLKVKKGFLIVTGILGLFLVGMVFPSPLFISDRLHVFNAFNRQGVEGPLYMVFQLWALAVLIFIPTILIHDTVRRTRGRGQGIRLILIGSMIAALCSVYDMAGTFVHLELFNNFSLFSAGVAFMCFTFAYDIARQTIRTAADLVRANILIQEQERALIEATRLELTGKLASGVVHDLRNAISIISLANSNLDNYAAKLGDDPPSADIREVVEHQRQSIEIAGFFLENIRHFARGNLEVDFRERFKSAGAFLELEKMLRVRIHEKRIRIRMDIEPDTILIGSRSHFLQVVLNLLLNAVDATGEGGEIRVSQPEMRDGRAVYHIADNGPGIPHEDRNRIFEFLYTTKESGSGIGLYIVQKIIEKNRADIRVLDTGPGCCFEFVWPVWNPEGISRYRPFRWRSPGIGRYSRPLQR